VEIVDGVKFWNHTNGNVSLPLPQGGNGATRSQWLLDGNPVDESEIDAMLLASEKTIKQTKEQAADKGQALFNTIKLENIVSIA
jgi:molybdopterin/thiamine biosynthesis adenylyltransferase